MRYLVTGGCGFIGSNFIYNALNLDPSLSIVNVDSLTYAGNIANVSDIADEFGGRYNFVRSDINNFPDIGIKFDAIINFAAESHVDNSITNPDVFVKTNVLGAYHMLEFARKHGCRFVQVSTDEVYGSLKEGQATEESPLNPSSPYSASKAAADLLVLGNFKTFNQDVVITRCTNNYGIYQHTEKLIPKAITHVLNNKDIPVYGDGQNVREWISVQDHCRGILAAINKGKAGEIYNFGSNQLISNIEIVEHILDIVPSSTSEIKFVEDRKGHDFRYAVDSTKARRELGWESIDSIYRVLPELMNFYKYA